MRNNTIATINAHTRNLEKLQKKNITFKGKNDFTYQLAQKYLSREDNVANNRFVSDTATNWLPKAIFARGLADFADMSFLEFFESGIFYFAPTGIGNRLKNVYSKLHPEKYRKDILNNVGKSAEEVINSTDLKKNDIDKKVLSTKAAIILACTAIPAAEYAISFAKNLFTLKVFKKSDFNNIANLNKKHVEDKKQQKHVEKNAIKNIKGAGIVSLGGLAASLIFAKYGHKSESLQRLSSLILQPGAHIANGLKRIGLIKSVGPEKGLEKFLKKYVTPDFGGIDEGINNKTGKKFSKFKLSEGQLLVTTVTGFFGYSAASKDRGKLDQYETWTRVPFVVLYTVFGSSLFNHLFNKFLIKKNIFPDVIKKGEKGESVIKTNNQLSDLAEKLAFDKKTSTETELKRLTKQKAIIKGVPFLFGIVFMGYLLSAITRFWTQYRFNHATQTQKDEFENNKLKK